MSKPIYTELDRLGNSRSQRWGARITNFLLHTQEGNGTAESLAAYLGNGANGVSYHYTLRDRIVCDVVDTDFASWSVLDANSHTINLCFAGSRASWTKAEWLAIEDDIRIAAWLAVADAKKYRFSTDVIAPPYAHRDGISDHKYVTECLGIGTHTDVGYNFPWREFDSYVREFARGAPAGPPPLPAIDVVAATAPWLGTRITVGEEPTRDGVGRFAKFEFGYAYWHPSTGAYAIPTQLFAKFAELDWENGPLGYPITASTELPGGLVQGFQGGALYFRDGHQTVWIHGVIRERWNRTGFESGRFGWPVRDEQLLAGGEAFQQFDNGRIFWAGRRDTIALLDAEGPDIPVSDRGGSKSWPRFETEEGASGNA
ncbi:N-acetylmuramoyl-L-alanine amidase [Nocardia sp. XZ_19_231]|uniref:N-acetylmuramoyl-L-alanine amidase n=1 Tax=Nocardia sp. XZ_19_231 TaxID=2769252 RepID=UPI00188E73A0|nr:N-acetylmuramoyl-L-alanine amidase [Nocardia sp. XZ_19_231]